MSTFNGLVAEFPDIRVDFFRNHAHLRPPLACFLSHVHSDHLAGLESLRSPFVYCSAATKEMLLRLERFPCRINYAKGILEARIQRYKHLKTLLKPLPLDTPTTLELEPGNHIRVTLFNANHCPGAVMILFEGQGKAALYTGDIRSEPWFVNTLVRSPSLIEYSYGFKTIDTIYLDTSFIDDDVEFPPKSDGLRELLEKVAGYPADTIFHFQAWTYGYEDVWIVLSKALNSKIHVDEYKMLIYSSLVEKGRSDNSNTSTGTARLPQQQQQQFHLCPEAAPLVGFICGNTHHPGCLTTLHDVDVNGERIRLHSCEKGNYCQTIVEKSSRGGVVWIQPITARLPDGQDIAEVGVGGGGDDLEREVELDYLSPSDIEPLLDIISPNTVENPQTLSSLAVTANDNKASENSKDKEQIRLFLLNAAAAGRKIPLDVGFSNFSDNNETELRAALEAIAQKSMPYRQQQPPASTGKSNNQYQQGRPELIGDDNDRERETLPSVITFPYSRHSSYQELCHLVGAFRPRDVWPCTVSPAEWYEKHITIADLFGRLCSGESVKFRHDELMKPEYAKLASILGPLPAWDSQASTTTTSSSVAEPSLPSINHHEQQQQENEQQGHEKIQKEQDAIGSLAPSRQQHSVPLLGTLPTQPDEQQLSQQHGRRRRRSSSASEVSSVESQPTNPPRKRRPAQEPNPQEHDSSSPEEADLAYCMPQSSSQASSLSPYALEARVNAFRAILGNAKNKTGTQIGLLCTSDNHFVPDTVLGE
ncbi:hypothetical protein B0T24DRAFT_83307 [Lasiosphaeria ovina]|uniref:Metallo-beta-lactamase domain-containing protein n=1 Tax=Lasiosphaeria ovina TaxID=92902 RepID=A0AAE0TYS5_9PEZI|nr:hypothetical protein B0T24DRAFT_83307 [Lasiosphaeria ovina]